MSYKTAYAGAPALGASVQKTLSQTFITVGSMWLLTAVASYFSLDLKLGIGAVLGLFALSIGLIFLTAKLRNSGYGLLSLAAFAGLQGVTLGPLLNHYLSMAGGAQIVTTAALLTGVATIASAGYAITSRRDFSQWGGFLFAGLIVVVVASLVNLFVAMPMLSLVISGVAAVLFVAYIMYDVGAVVNGQETSYISASLSIYLDMLNLFTSLLRLVGFVSSDD